MWIKITKIIINKVDAIHLDNPRNSENPMELILFQQEASTAFFISRNKKVLAEYYEKLTSRPIAKRKWNPEMHRFVQQELSKLPVHKGLFKITIIGWLFLLLAFGLLGYLAYEGLQEPIKREAYEQKMTEKSAVAVGDIYFGNYRFYKEKGNMLGSVGGFGWFKVVAIDQGVYRIAKSKEISKQAKPKEQMNSREFEVETSAVIAKNHEAYNKQFVSQDGLIEFNFEEKQE